MHVQPGLGPPPEGVTVVEPDSGAARARHKHRKRSHDDSGPVSKTATDTLFPRVLVDAECTHAPGGPRRIVGHMCISLPTNRWLKRTNAPSGLMKREVGQRVNCFGGALHFAFLCPCAQPEAHRIQPPNAQGSERIPTVSCG